MRGAETGRKSSFLGYQSVNIEYVRLSLETKESTIRSVPDHAKSMKY